MENPFQLIMDKLNYIENLIKETTNNNTRAEETIEIFNTKEAAAYIGVTKPTLYGYTHSRKIPHYKRGKRNYFKKAELDEWLTTYRVSSIEEIEKKANEYILSKRSK